MRGAGTFIDGLRRPELVGARHVVFVRSTEAHAEILGVETADAARRPGVVGVFTGADLTDVWPLPPRLPMMNKAMLRPMLANDRVRFVGEPVAVVVATTLAQAVDASELVVVDYERLPALVDLEESLAGEILIHEAAGT
ncbi:MAG: aerobic carbon-monoxide dehydrogenase large subunit, partial [Acidimicrobiaceae bacterium]|nr:aerobic carbon-monoxide dehydrogenase large subunit [Acidimicrobiaceae bacterium]